jgi:hypothetical protein
MEKIIATLISSLILTSPVMADPEIKGWKTYDSMGCMLLGECTDDVQQVRSISDIQKYYHSSNYSVISSEFNSILRSLDRVGVKVFLADEKYFPSGQRGVYHTVTNNFFLNTNFMHEQGVLMIVMRHEGWHAAQDCMAGTIDNSMIAIILPEEEIPVIWRVMAERTYPESAVPWEAEAGWAGRTDDVTAKALEACAKGSMWTEYEPTPMTREWLIENGFIE